MICTTTRRGMECFFMTAKGCSFNGGTCHPIVEKCHGCAHVITIGDRKFCKAFPDPASKWMLGNCNLATHVERKFVGEQRKINPLKASRKAAAGKM